jgi:hypothetical protein
MSFPRRLAVALSVAYVLSLVLVAVEFPSPTTTLTSSEAESTMSGAEAFRLSFLMTTDLGKAEDVVDYFLAFSWVANLPLMLTLIAGLRQSRVGWKLLVFLLVGLGLAVGVGFHEVRYLRVAYYLWVAILLVETVVVARAVSSRVTSGSGTPATGK